MHTNPRRQQTGIPGRFSRRQIIVGGGLAAVGAVVVAACGSDDDSGASATTGSIVGSAPPASSGTSSGTASITNKYGTYDIPLDPQRLVLMENRIELETATALGLAPAAVGYFYEFTGGPAPWVAPWVPFTPTGDEEVFLSFDTNTEYLLTLDGDLIMSGANWLDGDDPAYWSYPMLSQVAPVLPVALEPDWRTDLAQVAAWMGRDDRLAETLAEFDDLRDGIKAKHADKLATAPMAMGSAEPPALWLTDSTSGAPAATALVELGGQFMPFGKPEAAAFGWLELSPESIGELGGADGALIWSGDPAYIDDLTTNPVWSSIPTVADDHVVIADQNVGSGYLYTVMECMRLWDQVYDKLN